MHSGDHGTESNCHDHNRIRVRINLIQSFIGTNNINKYKNHFDNLQNQWLVIKQLYKIKTSCFIIKTKYYFKDINRILANIFNNHN